MNRSIWTWIQLAASITNAMFLVIAHVPSTGTAAEIASVLVGEAEQRIVAAAAQAARSATGGSASRL